MRFRQKSPDIRREIAKAKATYLANRRAAELYATDRAASAARQRLKTKMAGVGLGRLGNAVGATSALRKRQRDRQPYGVIYAKGGDQSRGGQALLAYSAGTYITPKRGKWLAFATNAVPRLIVADGRRQRTTPELFRNSPLASSIGKLVFVQISVNRAVLLIENVSLSPKTGRAKAATGRERSRVRVKRVVAFILIRATSRAQRFDKDNEIGPEAAKVPDYLGEFMAERNANRIVLR